VQRAPSTSGHQPCVREQKFALARSLALSLSLARSLCLFHPLSLSASHISPPSPSPRFLCPVPARLSREGDVQEHVQGCDTSATQAQVNPCTHAPIVVRGEWAVGIATHHIMPSSSSPSPCGRMGAAHVSPPTPAAISPPAPCTGPPSPSLGCSRFRCTHHEMAVKDRSQEAAKTQET